MKIAGTEIDKSKLMTKSEILDFLTKHGANDRSLAKIRERYQKHFGNELVWHYPISEGMHKALFIVVVKEGFLSIPYDLVCKSDYELLLLEKACLLSEESLEFLIDDFKLFSDYLLAALAGMRFYSLVDAET